MKVKAWNNGSHLSDGNGYGIKINAQDRDAIFHKEWMSIFLELDGEPSPVEININKASFWNETCHELISVRIGKWLIKNRFTPWEKGYPPVLNLVQIEKNRFRLSRA